MENFDKMQYERDFFLKENCKKDHVVLKGNRGVVLSAPHGVSQVRLGKLKYEEPGSLLMALCLQKETDSFFIAKTKNNNDDANFDEKSKYKKSLTKIIKKNNIKYVLDIHSLSAKRKIDVNLGIHLGKNIENNVEIFEKLCDEIIKKGFILSIDQPFMSGRNTISGTMKNKFPDLWTMQIEINCSIINEKKNFNKFKTLLDIFKEWINSLK